MNKKIIGCLIAVLLMGLLPSGAMAQTKERIEEIRTTIDNWVDLRKTIAKRKNDWRVEKELLQHRISLFEEEINSLQEQISEFQEGADEAQKKRADLQQQEEVLREAARIVETNIPRYENIVRELSAFFPLPLTNKVSTLMSNLPAQGARTNLGTSQRMATVVGILNEVDKFNNSISMENELREVDGQQIQVTTVYAGLSQAYYADESGKYAGVGNPARDEWEWTERNDIAPTISRAVGVAAGKIKPAVFVDIPIEVTSIPEIK